MIRQGRLLDLQQENPAFAGSTIASDGSTVIVPNEQIMQDILGLEPSTKRIMVGNHGVYVEHGTPQAFASGTTQPVVRSQYDEYRANGIKYYKQTKNVNYAEYKPGEWYSAVENYFDTNPESIHSQQGLPANEEALDMILDDFKSSLSKQHSRLLQGATIDPADGKSIIGLSALDKSFFENKEKETRGAHHGTSFQGLIATPNGILVKISHVSGRKRAKGYDLAMGLTEYEREAPPGVKSSRVYADIKGRTATWYVKVEDYFS
jgi:hypothetical protein